MALIFILILAIKAFGADCKLVTKLAQDPDLVKNEKFWQEYAKAGQNMSDKNLLELVAKHKEVPNRAQATQSTQSSLAVVKSDLIVERRGSFVKHVDRMPQHVQKHVDDFLNEVHKPGGIQNVYANPGRWHMEKLKEGGYSVRLNQGYRIRFEMNDSKITLIDAGQHVYHH